MAIRSVSHYELLESIGAGGMGEVFKAQDKRLHRFVAVKVLARGKSGDPDRRKRFIQEAQSASALSHPNIITIHDIFDEGDSYYIVMEYVAGKTLLDVIPPLGLRVGQVLQYSTQMADALNTAHAAGIIHRDFKPANVMVTSSGRVKILDFGLAKLTDPSSAMNLSATAGASTGGGPASIQDQATLTSLPLTMEGSILGTVNYMSPEQAEGRRVDARSDIFSFGAVLYEMITGRRAFQGDSDISTLSSVLRDEVRPMSEMVPDVPHELEDIVRGCLRKDPNDRWQSMKEVEMGLSGLKRRSDAGMLNARPAAPVSAVQQPMQPAGAVPLNAAATVPKKVLIGAGAGIVLLAAVGAGLWWATHRTPSPTQVAQSTPAVSQPVQTPAATQAPPQSTPESTPPPAAQQPIPAKSSAPAASSTPSLAPPPSGTPAPMVPASKAPAPPVVPAIAEQPQFTKPAPVRTPPQVVAVTIPDGQPFRIALTEDVPATAKEGQPLSFRVLDDLTIDGKSVILRGATVAGSIASQGAKKRFLGIGGKMLFQLSSADSADGKKLRVRAAAGTTPLDTGRYAKPKDLAAVRGTDYIAYVDGEQSVSIPK